MFENLFQKYISAKNIIFFIDNKFCVIYKPCRTVANIAQLVELLICNQWVGSSSLSVGTIKTKMHPLGAFFVLNIVDFYNKIDYHMLTVWNY